MKQRRIGGQGMTRRETLGFGLGTMAGLVLAVPGTARAQGGLKPLKLFHAAPITLGLWSVTYLAEDMGLYKEEGLALTRVGLANGPTAMAALLSGSGDANASAPGEVIAAAGRGQPLKILMSYSNSNGLTLVCTKAFAERHKLTAKSSVAEREAALKSAKGTRYGITSPGSQTDLFTRMAIKQVGLDPATDAQIVPLQNTANGLAALSKGGIDCLMALTPIAIQAQFEFGAIALLAVANGEVRAGARLQGQVSMARTQDVEANQDTFASMVRAEVRALRHIIEKPVEARDLLRKTRFANVKEEMWPAIWQAELPTFRSPYVTKDAISAWIETGMVGGASDAAQYPYDKLIDMRFVTAATAKIGWQVAKP